MTGWGRLRMLDGRAVNLDGLAAQDPSLGLAALWSPADPLPSLVISDGVVVELDGRRREDFDVVDAFIAEHGLDLTVAEEAMATDDVTVARMIVDPSVPRAEITRLVAGMTPAKLAAVVRQIRPYEITIALAKMRVRRTPSNQAHVTNRLDDPLLLAADAATAVAYGFRELETTVPVFGDAPSNAVAVLIGSQVAAAGALTQCSVEEALELQLGVRGLVSYAETVSVYGTEQVFVDGDDTPWSKAFLVAAYASRGVKMRLSSGAGSEALMGGAEGRSMLYLESRCVSLARACGAQGVQNGGIDTAALTASVPGGVLELHYENLMVMLRGLESCSGNDSLMSESDMRRTARTLPTFLAGSDFIVSGFGSIPRYDNMFGPSNLNAEDLDDYLVLQRDWGVDGALRQPTEEYILAVRRRAAEAVRAVYAHLGLADFDDEHVEAVVHAAGSRDLPEPDPLRVLQAARMIGESGLTGLDIVAALDECGFSVEAERVLGMLRARVAGDYLQPAAIFDESMRCLSAVTDPNDYAGPGTGYVPGPERLAEIAAVRQERSVADLRAEQAAYARPGLSCLGAAAVSNDPREVVIGVSPALGRSVWRTLSGLDVLDVLDELLAGLEEEGCRGRIVRVQSSIDLGQIGLAAAQLSGSGVSIGLQGKGTALIHRRDLTPLANLELYSVAPHVTREMYRLMAVNAARHAKGATPEPVLNPYSEDAITARYHTRVVSFVALERECCDIGSAPEELSLEVMDD
ncbi:propanediol/glycerol family dehydratase large subunit [Planosporangium flavigriseum]|uniref:Glycerol dehydratase large subunit n=1 Tax=Planosporangium flavigriseum TaxID=373681 RepID=A0A8J3LWM6_9ACTN|nr:propanediol/glycerol family dehydratase large subunit [Planosporangium flavigriseum]NJC66149.1 propanediol/glycerol family dehydratase large subunit [Planosporangium flavigriseum]GIG75159.1 glycerol dehydratase large subunit [Planosporangium flavigriseum]